MPQMAPYNWLMLMFMFNVIMYFVISYIYFMMTYELELLDTTKMKNNYMWMW